MTDVTSTVRFHLHEIASDLRVCADYGHDLRQRLSDMVAQPGARWDRRIIRDLDALVGTVQHDLDHHVAEALTLARGDGHVATQVEVSGADSEENAVADRLSIVSRVDALVQALKTAELLAQQAADVSGEVTEAAEPIARLRAFLAISVLRPALDLEREASALHYVMEPADLEEDAEQTRLATPLRTEVHPAARHLASCPRCGAELSDDDRTFTGSYCEHCRTRWLTRD